MAAEGYKGDAVVIGASAAAIGCLAVVAAHQFGALDHLPDPPGSFFASDRITESKMAHPMGVPDSVPGIGSYAVTFGLAIWARRSAAARQMLAAKLLVDSGMAGFNAVRQVVRFGKMCTWCTGVVVCTAVSVAAAHELLVQEVPRTVDEVRELASEVEVAED